MLVKAHTNTTFTIQLTIIENRVTPTTDLVACHLRIMHKQKH
jgi:hypothetical protein